MPFWYKHPLRPRWIAWRYLLLARRRQLTYPTLEIRPSARLRYVTDQKQTRVLREVGEGLKRPSGTTTPSA